MTASPHRGAHSRYIYSISHLVLRKRQNEVPENSLFALNRGLAVLINQFGVIYLFRLASLRRDIEPRELFADVPVELGELIFISVG